MKLLQRHLLATLTVAVLCASLAPLADSLPLSGAESTTRRQSPAESHSPTDRSTTGSVERRVLRDTHHDRGNGTANNSTSGGEDIDTVQTCMETCYSHVPQEKVKDMEMSNHDNFVWDGIHPGFVLGLWLENYHRQQFCSDWVPSRDCEATSTETRTQRTGDIIGYLTETIQSTLTGYTVTFDESYYPRYTVHPPCSSGIDTGVKHLEYIDDDWYVTNYDISCH